MLLRETQMFVKKLGIAGNTCIPSTWEVEARRSGIQGQPWLQSQLEASQSIKHCFKINNKNKWPIVRLFNVIRKA